MEKFIALFVVLFSLQVSAQEVCYSKGECVDDGEAVRSEIVPQTELAKCEDYKVQAISVPGLILAERQSLVAASECKGAKDIFAFQLTERNLELGKEHQKRIDAESRVLFVGIIVAIVSVGVTLVGVFLVSSFQK